MSEAEPTVEELLTAVPEYDTSKPKSLERWPGWRLYLAPTGELEVTESTIAGVMDDCSFARRANLMRQLKPHDGGEDVQLNGGKWRVRLPKVEVYCWKCTAWIRLLDMNQHLRRGKCRHLLTVEDQAIRAAERYRAPGDMSPYLNAEWRKAFIESLKTQGCNPDGQDFDLVPGMRVQNAQFDGLISGFPGTVLSLDSVRFDNSPKIKRIHRHVCGGWTTSNSSNLVTAGRIVPVKESANGVH